MQAYQVKTGDTLISIARQWMGTGDAWRLIAQLNGLGDPSQLKVGQTLKIPVTEYTVQSGDSLRRIAQRELGTEAAWKNIAVLNNITDPRFLVIGQRLRLPVPIQTGVVRPGTNGNLGGGPSPVPSDREPQTSNGNERSYSVQRGDSLITIAQKTLGDRSRWREIALRNNITNPADLRVGTMLKLPPLKGASPSPGSAPHQPPSGQSISPPTSPETQPSPKPTASPETPAQPSQSWNYTVVRGDTLIGIARKTLGNGNRWQDIAELNGLASPSDLRVGKVLRIPGSPATGPNQPPAQPVPVQPAPSQPETASPGDTTGSYKVQRGDTLMGIARKTLGDGDRWPEIASLNGIEQPSDLRVGMVLEIPAQTGSTPLPPAPVVPSGPSTYRVQPGDSLYSIAAKRLGDRGRWSEIGRLNSLPDPSKLRVGTLLLIPGRDGDPGPQSVASILSEDQGKADSKLQSVKFITRQDNVFAQWVKQDGGDAEAGGDREDKVGVLYQKGLFRRGEAKPRDFIQLASGILRRLHLSDSEMNAIAAISDNEGYLDAVNTWDSQYLSFGLFQWTAGSVERPGELAALLSRLKQTYPDEFQHYFGQFGLDVEDSNSVLGWISLNGVRLDSEYQKSLLRQPIWAYRFAIAGQDTTVKSVQIRHAVERIDRFYFIRHSGLDGYSLSDLIQSEFGVTLLLDNHVNRPAYVVPGIVVAMQQLGVMPQSLASGSTETELRVLERYLQVRQTYGSKPMTHAKTRGDRISRQVREGRLSQERGSFVSNMNQRVG